MRTASGMFKTMPFAVLFAFSCQPISSSLQESPYFSMFHSPMVRRSGSKLMPTFTTGRPESENFEA